MSFVRNGRMWQMMATRSIGLGNFKIEDKDDKDDDWDMCAESLHSLLFFFSWFYWVVMRWWKSKTKLNKKEHFKFSKLDQTVDPVNGCYRILLLYFLCFPYCFKREKRFWWILRKKIRLLYVRLSYLVILVLPESPATLSGYKGSNWVGNFITAVFIYYKKRVVSSNFIKKIWIKNLKA